MEGPLTSCYLFAERVVVVSSGYGTVGVGVDAGTSEMIVCQVCDFGIFCIGDDCRILRDLFSDCIKDEKRHFITRNFFDAFSVAVVNGMKIQGA